MKICDNLYKYLVLKLGKQDIEKEDLENIENLSLVFDKEEKINYDFKDLLYFKNLKELTIIGASINNFEINCINRIDTLKELTFIQCRFKAKCNLCNNIEEVIVQKCKNFKKEYVSELNNIKNIKIEK